MKIQKLLFLILIPLVISACNENKTSGETVEPAKLEDIPGSPLHKVILTKEAAKRIDLQTVKISTEGTATTIPYNAMLYDPNGQAWVYTVTAKLTYVRAPIQVDSVAGDKVILKNGPPAGTEIVAIGVSELYGSEYLGNIEE